MDTILVYLCSSSRNYPFLANLPHCQKQRAIWFPVNQQLLSSCNFCISYLTLKMVNWLTEVADHKHISLFIPVNIESLFILVNIECGTNYLQTMSQTQLEYLKLYSHMAPLADSSLPTALVCVLKLNGMITSEIK